MGRSVSIQTLCCYLVSIFSLHCFTLPAHAAAWLTSIAAIGQTTPNGNGTFESLVSPAISDSGDVVFFSELAGTHNSADDIGLYRWSQSGLQTIVQENDPAPEGNGTFTDFILFSMNAAGEVAFEADIHPPPGSFSTSGVYRSTPGSPVAKIVREDDSMPGISGTIRVPSTSLTMADNGVVVLNVGLSTNSKQGLYRSDGASVTKLVAPNEVTSVNGMKVQEVSFWGYGNAHGVGGAVLNLNDPATPASVDSSGIFRADGSSLTPLVLQGAASPDGNGTFGAFTGPVYIGRTGAIAFISTLTGTTAGSLDNTGLFIATDAGVKLVARTNEQLPIGDGVIASGITSGFSTRVPLNASGRTTFRAQLSQTPGGTLDDTALFVGDGDSLTQIARENQLVPNGNGRFSIFNVGLLNDSGTVAFTASLRDTQSGQTERGLYLSRNGSLFEAFRTGEPLAGSTIDTFSFRLGPDDSRGLNNLDEIAFSATLADGRNVIGLYTPGAMHGDFNEDGVVDAVDYVFLRHHNSPAADYNTWRSNFGQHASASGSGTIASPTVPEPSSILLLLAAAAISITGTACRPSRRGATVGLPGTAAL